MKKTLVEDDIDYFNRGSSENPKFWKRFGGIPEMKDKRILDLGCGHGSMCIYLAQQGAGRVIGIDLDEQRIQFAKENLRTNYPEFSEKVIFSAIDILDLKEDNFDFVVSKDAFEHIIELEKIIKEIRKKLSKNGKLFTGFGALYNVFNGDHGRTKAIIPWGHLIIPEPILLKRLNKNNEKKINSVYDLGLNKLSLSDYKSIFKNSGMKVTFFKVNQSERLMAKVFNVLASVPFLEEYFSYMIHAVLQKEN